MGMAVIAGAVAATITSSPAPTSRASNARCNAAVPVLATGAAGVFLTNSTVLGPVSISGTTGTAAIADTTVGGPVRLSDNHTTGGAILVAGNTVAGPLRRGGNTPDPVNIEIPNTVTGPKTGQCTHL
jgi:hypothetical protein